MRVLVNFSTETKTKAVLEIAFATYDNDIYNNFGKIAFGKPIEGLLLYATNRMVYVIENISKEDCDNICNELFLHEKADLTKYKDVEFLNKDKLDTYR